MFIENIMKLVLKPVSDNYFKEYTRAKKLSSQKLYDELLQELMPINTGDSLYHGTTIFATPGCSHNVRDGNHAGCSFCDWNESYIAHPAKVRVLRDKNPQLYQQFQYESLCKSRSNSKDAKFMEEYAIHDCFDDSQITQHEMEHLFFEKKFYKKMPVVALVQARVENITVEKILFWKEMSKKQLTLGIGVETGDEWLRNHWLNKNNSDKDIENAIKIAHENKCKISANILLSLPGLSDKQSFELFFSSIDKLIDLGVDSIMISPLIVKKYTLQNYIKYSNDNSSKRKLFYLIKMLDEIKNRQEIRKYIMFSSLNFSDYFDVENIKDKNILVAFKNMLSIGASKNFDKWYESLIPIINSNEYKKYLEDYRREPGFADIKTTLSNQVEDLCSSLEIDTDESKRLISEFEYELDSYKEMPNE